MPRRREKKGQYGSQCCNKKHIEWTGRDNCDSKPQHFCPKDVLELFVSMGARKSQRFCKECIAIGHKKLKSQNVPVDNTETTDDDASQTSAEDAPNLDHSLDASSTDESSISSENNISATTSQTLPDPDDLVTDENLIQDIVSADIHESTDDDDTTDDDATSQTMAEETPTLDFNAQDIVSADIHESTDDDDTTDDDATSQTMAEETPSLDFNAQMYSVPNPLPLSLLPSHSQPIATPPILFHYPTITNSESDIINFPVPPSNWLTTTSPNANIYIAMNHIRDHQPIVSKSLTVNSNGSWIFTALGRKIGFLPFPSKLKSSSAQELLDYVDQLKLCMGNPKPELVAAAERRSMLIDQMVLEDEFRNVRLKTVRNEICPIAIESGIRCSHCTDQASSLRAMASRDARKGTDPQKRTRADSKTPMASLRQEELILRARELSKSNRNLKQKVSRLLKRQLHDVVRDESLDIGDDTVSQGLYNIMEEKTSQITSEFEPGTFGHLFWEQQIKALRTSDPRGYRWHPMVIKWCLNLRMASRKAYHNMTGVLKLPNEATLRSYIHWTKPSSGFSMDAVKQLLRQLNIQEREEYQKYFIIVHDEMKIQSDLVYSKSSGKLVGFTDLGSYQNMLQEFESELQQESAPEKNLAKYVLVFQIRGLFWNFQFPMAHFPTSATKGHQIFNLFWRAVEILELAGLKIVGVTCDGAATNRKFLDMHGHGSSSATNPVFRAPNPYAVDIPREIFLLNDPPHLIKCVRNAWASKKRMLWNNGNISWKMVEDLYYSDVDTGGLYLNKKLSYEHIDLTSYSKMKVGLAAEVLSRTVANALSVFYASSSQTVVEFIETFDRYFDLLNVRSRDEAIRKRKPELAAYTSTDDWRLKWLRGDFIAYLDNWDKAVKDRPGVYNTTQRNKMQIPSETTIGLRRTAKAFVAMAEFLLPQPGVQFILSEKFNQDKLENMFGNIRQGKGGNDAPTIAQVNSQMNVLRMKPDQQLSVLKGNTSSKCAVEDLQIDDTKLPKRRKPNPNSKT